MTAPGLHNAGVNLTDLGALVAVVLSVVSTGVSVRASRNARLLKFDELSWKARSEALAQASEVAIRLRRIARAILTFDEQTQVEHLGDALFASVAKAEDNLGQVMLFLPTAVADVLDDVMAASNSVVNSQPGSFSSLQIALISTKHELESSSQGKPAYEQALDYLGRDLRVFGLPATLAGLRRLDLTVTTFLADARHEFKPSPLGRSLTMRTSVRLRSARGRFQSRR